MKPKDDKERQRKMNVKSLLERLEEYCEWCKGQGGDCQAHLQGCAIYDILEELKQQPEPTKLANVLRHAAMVSSASVDNESYQCGISIKEANQAADILDQQAEENKRLKKKINQQAAQIIEYEETEALICPEDVGIKEYVDVLRCGIQSLKRKINQQAEENKQPKETRKHVGWYYPEREQLRKTQHKRHEHVIPVFAIEEIKGNELELEQQPKCKTCGGTKRVPSEYGLNHCSSLPIEYARKTKPCPDCQQPEPTETMAEQIARKSHETYEKLAPEFSYETRKSSACPWRLVPPKNKKLMIAVANEIKKLFIDQQAEENKRLKEKIDVLEKKNKQLKEERQSFLDEHAETGSTEKEK